MKQMIAALLILLTFSSMSRTQNVPGDTLMVGDQAPDFVLPYATRDSVASEDLTLSTLFGKSIIILAFYPADWSGGCTREVCTFRDNFATLSELHAEILGISGDYEYSHHEWAKHLDLPFKLVSDHAHTAAKMYFSYNAQYLSNKRTVYLVDRKGKIAYIDLKYSSRDITSFEKLKSALTLLK